MFLKKSATVLALLAATTAAQSEVILHGVMDVSFGSYQRLTTNTTTNVVGSERQTKVSSGDMTASYIGFKGTEDLGGGLKAVFSLESYVNADTGATPAPNSYSTFWGRNTYVGLASDVGTITLGRADTLYFQQATAFNPFGASGQYSPTVRLAMGAVFADNQTATDLSFIYNTGFDLADIPFYGTGWSNAITITTADFGGFVGGLQVGLKEDGAQTQGRFAVSGAYNAGPLGLSLVFANDKYTERGDKLSSFLAGASYDLGVAKLYGQLGNHTIKLVGGTSEDIKLKFMQFGAGIPVSAAGSVLVSFGQTKFEDFVKIRDFSIGYDHALSKRTDAYVALRDERLSANGESVKQNALSTGVRHRF